MLKIESIFQHPFDVKENQVKASWSDREHGLRSHYFRSSVMDCMCMHLAQNERPERKVLRLPMTSFIKDDVVNGKHNEENKIEDRHKRTQPNLLNARAKKQGFGLPYK